MASIDVIVPAFNAETYIKTCLKALGEAGFSQDEIIVVDDGSTDATIEIARTYGARVIETRTNAGAAAARNTGAAASTRDILFFVDADVMVHSDTKEVVSTFFNTHPSFAAVFGAYDEDPAAPEPVSRARNLLHRFVHLESAGEVVSFWTGCGAVRRAAFEQVGGFDDTLDMMEDIDLGLRLSKLGHRTMLLPDLQGQHHKRWTLVGMAKTDFFDRALPWARLLRDAENARTDGLNISNRSRASVLAVAAVVCAVAAMIAAPQWGAVAGLAALAVLVGVNGRFLNMVRRIDGWAALPAAVLVLFVHYLCGGLGFAIVKLRLDRYFS
ncbi:glycosyltransferase [Tropicimonas sp. S265A]|uniref:glycosyltransferase n=1 Tax=Tropicimonas sp. S265A TaxID=3415134 RepID=UPI003C7EC384